MSSRELRVFSTKIVPGRKLFVRDAVEFQLHRPRDSTCNERVDPRERADSPAKVAAVVDEWV